MDSSLLIRTPTRSEALVGCLHFFTFCRFLTQLRSIPQSQALARNPQEFDW
ncbi:hypothetical protein OOK60_14115 [Trichothermofontia sichuanensis B231]|uniref:hypothetical protein n=1 Tax=Trichothermofontia sichuanensis TaxID=3045816 RepID=UPI00224738A7|nr:hypothetical protein [Trichothermofontia sichuanensis]UZQ53623.1 hypothetical protein OOK60_14115 [Trichothermofontia sichuanensis B231]